MKEIIKRAICSAFMELCSVKPIDKIKVSDILEKCDISRPTFYKYFPDKYAVMNYVYQVQADFVCTNLVIRDDDYLGALEHVLLHCLEYKSFYIAAAEYHGQNDFESFFYDSTVKAYSNFITHKHGNEALTPAIMQSIKFNCAGANKLFLEWIRNGMKEDYKSLSREIIDNIPLPMKELL